MLRSHSHRAGNALLALISISILALSFRAHSDNSGLADNDFLLDPHETNQRMLNALWLEQGMQETPKFYEKNEAVQKLTQTIVKKYWAALVRKDRSYERYTPLVSGHFASSNNETNYDFHITSNIIKFSVSYSF